MRRFLAAQFAPVLRAWRNGYEAEVRRAAIAFFLLVFLAFGVCLAVPELRLGFSAYLQHLFQGMDLTDGAGNLSPLLLLANNLRACAVTMLYGLIPFVRLPALALGVNAVLLGGLAACYAATDTTMLLYAAVIFLWFKSDKSVGIILAGIWLIQNIGLVIALLGQMSAYLLPLALLLVGVILYFISSR